MSEALVLASLVRTIAVPGLIADAGDDTSRKFLEILHSEDAQSQHANRRGGIHAQHPIGQSFTVLAARRVG